MYKMDLKALLHEITLKSLIAMLEEHESVEDGLFFIDETRAENYLLQVEGVYKLDDTNTELFGDDEDYATKVSIELRLSSDLLMELLAEHGRATFKYLKWNFVLPIYVLSAERLTVENCVDAKVLFDSEQDEKLIYRDFGDLTELIGTKI